MRIDTTRSLTVWSICRSDMIHGSKGFNLTVSEQQTIVGLLITQVPFPTVYGNEDRDGVVTLDDGGIFEFIQSFIEGRVSVESYGCYDNIAPLQQSTLEDTTIRTVIVQQPTDDEDKHLIHQRLNIIFNILYDN